MPLTHSQLAHVGIEDLIAKFAQVRHVALRLPVRPHPIVHGWDNEDRCLCREQTCAEQVIRLAGGRTSHEISGSRCDDHQFSGSRKTNVVERVTSLDQLGMNRSASQCFEGDCADELRSRFREDDIHFSRRLREQPRQPRRFVAGNPPGDPE